MILLKNRLEPNKQPTAMHKTRPEPVQPTNGSLLPVFRCGICCHLRCVWWIML